MAFKSECETRPARIMYKVPAFICLCGSGIVFCVTDGVAFTNKAICITVYTLVYLRRSSYCYAKHARHIQISKAKKEMTIMTLPPPIISSSLQRGKKVAHHVLHEHHQTPLPPALALALASALVSAASSHPAILQPCLNQAKAKV